MTVVAEQYATAAELLRRLTSRPDRLVRNGDSDLAGLTDALAVAAQACEQVDEANRAREDAEQECGEAMLQAAHLWSLLDRAAEVVEAHIAHNDGGAWEMLTLAFELRQAVEIEPDALGARLLGELHAARVALRAAGGWLRRCTAATARQSVSAWRPSSRRAVPGRRTSARPSRQARSAWSQERNHDERQPGPAVRSAG